MRVWHARYGGSCDLDICDCDCFALARMQAGTSEPPEAEETIGERDSRERHARWDIKPAVEQADTVTEGPEEGEVCVGRGVGKFPGDAHRPVVRGESGRCFICEPMTALEKLTKNAEWAAEQAVAVEHGAVCHEDCDCQEQPMKPVEMCEEPHETIEEEEECDRRRQHDSADFAEAPPVQLPPHSPTPLPPYVVTLALEGGQLYEVGIPGDASVMAVDGILKVYFPSRPVLGIVAVRTHPALTMGEARDPDSEDVEDHGGL